MLDGGVVQKGPTNNSQKQEFKQKHHLQSSGTAECQRKTREMDVNFFSSLLDFIS